MRIELSPNNVARLRALFPGNDNIIEGIDIHYIELSPIGFLAILQIVKPNETIEDCFIRSIEAAQANKPEPPYTPDEKTGHCVETLSRAIAMAKSNNCQEAHIVLISPDGNSVSLGNGSIIGQMNAICRLMEDMPPCEHMLIASRAIAAHLEEEKHATGEDRKETLQ